MFRGNSRGTSLAELMVAMVILTIAVIGGMSSFRSISMAIRSSRAKTIASNLASERMEVMKNMSYYQLIVTTDTDVNTDYTPNIVYDRVNYLKETIDLWGLPPFSRAVYVSYASRTQLVGSDNIAMVPSNSDDTGLKVVVVYTWWTEDNARKKVEIRNLYANPAVSPVDSGFGGLVRISGGGALSGASVSVVGNANWSTSTNGSAGTNYTLSVPEGTYSLQFSASGYVDQILNSQTCVRGSTTTVATVDMVPISVGTVVGEVWISTSVLISQVVASTPAANGDPVEYVELYNPTTYTWTASDATLQLWYRNKNSGGGAAKIPLDYPTANISSNTYYLIANVASLTVGGVTRTADAKYQTLGNNTIVDNSDGGVGIQPSGGGHYDAVAWGNGVGPDPPELYTRGVALSTALASNMQYVRYTSTATYSSSYGSAYNTNNNSVNFQYNNGITVAPSNSSVSRIPICGVPGAGAVAIVNDGYSPVTQAVAFNAGTSQEYAQLVIPDIKTGTWSVKISSGNYFLSIATVIVSNGVSTFIPNSATTPSWPATGVNASILTSTASGGFIHGYAYGAGAAFSTPLYQLKMEANGTTVRTAYNGYYMINTTTGTTTLNANYNLDDPAYVSDSASADVFNNAFTAMADFHLGTSGIIKGYVTSESAAYPNIVVRATLGGDTEEGVSDQSGFFYITVPASASEYTIVPALDSIQTYTLAKDGAEFNPMVTTVTANQTVFVGTITITGGSGSITGRVTASGSPITTGVLIIASSASLASIGSPPPLIYGSSAAGQAFLYYAASSLADGTYSLDARPGNVNMRAYYPIVTNAGTVSYTYQDLSSVTVVAGSTTANKNFAW